MILIITTKKIWQRKISTRLPKFQIITKLILQSILSKINNATRPYVLAFAESFYPLWQAYLDTESDSNKVKVGVRSEDDFKTNSIPLYGLTNVFYISKSGDYNLIIEYQPQKWVMQGAIISTMSLIALFAGFLLLSKRRTMERL
jgi:hypothetical protein